MENQFNTHLHSNGTQNTTLRDINCETKRNCIICQSSLNLERLMKKLSGLSEECEHILLTDIHRNMIYKF